MKHDGYFNRALKANDPRYARVFGKLGYDTTALRADTPQDDSDVDLDDAPADDELKAARAEYQQKVGKKAFHGWGTEELRTRIAAEEADQD